MIPKDEILDKSIDFEISADSKWSEVISFVHKYLVIEKFKTVNLIASKKQIQKLVKYVELIKYSVKGIHQTNELIFESNPKEIKMKITLSKSA